jgi:tRNA A-37 threonylcarbamoyl transferase component Bud32
MRLAPGAEVGPYRVVEQVGQGGMATVYKVYQAALSRFVALKVLPPYLAAEPDFETRFRDEAVRLAALRHPSIPAVFDYGTIEGVTYIASDFIDGGTLSDQLGSPLPLDYTASLLAPVASALDYAHSRGVVHRDIKPSNILLTRDGKPMLTDFGIARMLAPDHSLTQTGMILGTPQYMAPEQGSGETSAAGDIYSLGVVAYHMLTGRVPFDAATPMAVILAKQQDPLPLPRSLNPNIPEHVEEILLKALSRDPAARHTSAAGFIRALGDAAQSEGKAAGGAPPRPPDATVPLPATSPVPRGNGRRWAAVAVIGVVALVALGAGYFATRPHGGGGIPAASPAPAVAKVAKWQQWVHMTAALDVDGPRSDGRLLVASNGGLQLLGLDGSFGAYSPTYKVDAGAEAYIAVSPGLTMTKPACSFPADDTYALHVQPPFGITRIDGQGKVSTFATLNGFDSLNGLAFDTGGKFGHSLLVIATRQNAGVVIAVDCAGNSTTPVSGSRIEGGISVAPATFGTYGGQLIAPDEVTGGIFAFAPGGTSAVAVSGLPVGGDIGVESAGFVPAGFMAKGGFAYVADRATPKNAHPGTDSILRLSSADLAAAGVKDGDLLVVTEGGSLTISVRCGTECVVRKVATGPDVAHGEGHIAFSINK